MADLIPTGQYKARATKNWALSESSQKGTPYVHLELEILAEGHYQGRLVYKDLWLTDGAWEYSLKDLRTCGWTGTDISDLTGVEANEVNVTIEHEAMTDKESNPLTDDDGRVKMRARVRWINPRVKEMDPGKKSQFLELMNARIRQAKANEASPDFGRTGTDDLPDFLR